jgi:RsmE family RNA methyltransferase
MNLLLFSGRDLEGHRLIVSDDRARHIRRVLGKGVGDEIRVGQIGGLIGRGRILRLDEKVVELRVELDVEPPPTLGIDLVLALPRPKFVGRIVQAVASMGVERLTLLQTGRVQKSYWQSSVLETGSIERHLRLGLEQGGATTMPVVELRRQFRPFVEQELAPRLVERPGMVADAAGAEPFPRQVLPPHTLIVGPEGGWLDDDLEALRAAGTRVVSLGPRALKVEVAVVACLSRCLPT